MNNTSPFSNEDKRVFILKIENQIDKGALLSRYSRTSNLDIRDLYKKEFENNPERGKNFYEKVFLEYGDESVAELVTVQVGIQGVSNVVSKIIESSRIGLSYLEKSSRYVSYVKKFSDKYLYLSFKDTDISSVFEKPYEELMDKMFLFYSENVSTVEESLRREFPESTFEIKDKVSGAKAYAAAIRSRALDEIRGILPASTLTNMGISGNIRSFISLIQHLYASGIGEAKEIADLLYNELYKDFENLVKSAKNKHGLDQINYLSKDMRDTKKALTEPVYENRPTEVEMLYYEKDACDKINEILSFRYANYCKESEKLMEIISDQRKDRREKLPREFEFVNLAFKVKLNYGAFRELQRHRFLSIVRKPLDCSLGYFTPPYISKNEQLNKKFKVIIKEAIDLWKQIVEISGTLRAQYVIPYCTNYETLIQTNLRELVYFSELRTTPQSHSDLREVAIMMVDKFLEREPKFKNLFKLVDRNEYPIGRFFQEYRREEKLRDFEEK
jgi:thymidylate synthase ThyX